MKKRRSFTSRVRLALALRLLLLALALSLVFGGIASYRAKNRMEERIVEIVRGQAGFHEVDLRNLEPGVEPDYASLAADARSFLELEPGHGLGRFVFARMFDGEGRATGTFFELEGHQAARIEPHLDDREPRRSGDTSVRSHRTRILGDPHVLFDAPILDRNGTYLGRVEAAFQVSERAVSEVMGAVWFAMLAAVGIIFVTTAAIYPIVMRLTHGLVRLSGNLLQANTDTAAVLGGAIAQRDSDTSEHNFRVTVISVRIAEALKLDSKTIRALIRGAFVHDVGKIGIPDAILLKPGRLDEEEFEHMKSHVRKGAEIVSHSRWLTRGSEVVRYHHEKFDGSGYLEGLRGEEIPITARIFAVADVFDACASRRPYKEPFTLERTREILEEGRGTHFDPQVLDAFGPLAQRLHRDLIAQPREEPAAIMQEIARRYYGEVIEELSL